jgi:plasmid stabilization system protein ParE
MRLRLHPAALAELDEAVGYLEEQRPGFGALMFEEISRRIGQAARLPTSGVPISGFAAKHDVRQFVAKRFPYIVVTALVAEERLVVAVAHTSRAPRYWRERLP